MSGLVLFAIFKAALMFGALAFAIREFVAAGRPDSNPELTERMLRIFSAGDRARRPSPRSAPPESVPEPVAAETVEEAPRRVA